ncbi:hypothetical protein HO173_009418 [Letharia columbiana]|uniref:Uncharacterized protein n=1 Tax=Letharia columbiana TaxID=112416 RepID=A0A8H6FPK5_9LECA|nr:uncharacterized protein HO173_009418 [Letharia columbiana]KAF6232313.1 hypothetical protein HO173_009418 [Letharia columbiana]
MSEPEMREPCEAFQKARTIKRHLKSCPGDEIPVIRPLSGHGVKVCGTCSKKNRNEQRKRENAQKRARRAKLKRNKMTAGIGAGNVVWAPPNTWPSIVVDSQTLALHSPQPKPLNDFNVRSMTQALQHGLNGSISTAMMSHNHVSVSQHERGVYSQSHQVLAATMSNALQLQEDGHDRIATEMRDDVTLHHQYKFESPDLPTTMLDVPVYQEQQCQHVGPGITMADDAKWEQSRTETCTFSEWSFRMELNEWSTVFDDNDDPDGGKEL